MPAATTLRIAIGDYPHTLPLKRGEIASPWLKLDFVEVKPMHTAFKPMVREHAFDASEMALVTYLQAKAYKKGLKLLPAAMLARFQHGTVLYNSERGVLGPNDLAGKRIGVRSYSQTTGVWMRGILQNDYGVDLSGVQWVTFEDGHVAEAKDPPASSARCGQGHHRDAARRRTRCRDLRRGHAEGRAAQERHRRSGRRGAVFGTPSTIWCRSITWWW